MPLRSRGVNPFSLWEKVPEEPAPYLIRGRMREWTVRSY